MHQTSFLGLPNLHLPQVEEGDGGHVAVALQRGHGGPGPVQEELQGAVGVDVLS